MITVSQFLPTEDGNNKPLANLSKNGELFNTSSLLSVDLPFSPNADILRLRKNFLKKIISHLFHDVIHRCTLRDRTIHPLRYTVLLLGHYGKFSTTIMGSPSRDDLLGVISAKVPTLWVVAGNTLWHSFLVRLGRWEKKKKW